MQNLISSLQDHFKLRISGNQDEKYGLYNFSVKPDGDFLPNREQFEAEVMEILEKNSYYLMDDTYLVYQVKFEARNTKLETISNDQFSILGG